MILIAVFISCCFFSLDRFYTFDRRGFTCVFVDIWNSCVQIFSPSSSHRLHLLLITGILTIWSHAGSKLVEKMTSPLLKEHITAPVLINFLRAFLHNTLQSFYLLLQVHDHKTNFSRTNRQRWTSWDFVGKFLWSWAACFCSIKSQEKFPTRTH